jgi:hypothetical protein
MGTRDPVTLTVLVSERQDRCFCSLKINIYTFKYCILGCCKCLMDSVVSGLVHYLAPLLTAIQTHSIQARTGLLAYLTVPAAACPVHYIAPLLCLVSSSCFLFILTTVSFVAQLTVVSNWLTSNHQSCCWDSCAKPFSLLPELFKCSWLCAAHCILQVTPQEKVRHG